jgi:aminocarboxymuconate-semialdehyde decarboxylase
MTKVVDVHSHYVGEDAVRRIREEGERHGVTIKEAPEGPPRIDVGGRLTGLPLLPTLTKAGPRLNWLELAGVDVQLVAGWMDLAGYHLPAEDGRWLAEVQNDAIAALVASAPDRYVAAAAVALQDPEIAAKELDRAVTQLGHRAVQIGARVEETGLDDPALDPFWAAAERLGTLVVIHPAELSVPDRHRRLFLHILTGNPAETTHAAAAIMLGGVLDRFARLRFLLVHGGGYLPYQIGRLDRGAVAAPPPVRTRSARTPRQHLSSFYFDTVLHDDDALRYLSDVAGADHVVLGSDYPFPMRDDSPVATVERAVADPSSRTTILSHTASGLLGGAC